MPDTTAVLFGFFGVLAGGYVNNFVAEDYRRFRDAQALAGALSGELQSHSSAMPMLLGNLEKMKIIASEDRELGLPDIEKPTSPIFEANVQRIGLLGPKLACDVAAVYEQINGFRVAFVMLAKNDTKFSKEQRSNVIQQCVDRLNTAQTRGGELLDGLNTLAHARYLDKWLRVG
jgi:hypothetical protein